MKRYRSVTTMKKRLVELVNERTFKFSDKPTFKLASGNKSSYYFNCKPTTLNAEGMYLIGHLLYDMIRQQKKWKPEGIGGLTLGADSPPDALAYTPYFKSDPPGALFV